MSDPDVTSRAKPDKAQIKHWLLGNIPGNDYTNPTVTVLANYLKPRPGEGTLYHRYVFVVFEQPGESPIDFNETVGPRSHFDLRKFSAKYHLGEPVAVNFLLSIFTPARS